MNYCSPLTVSLTHDLKIISVSSIEDVKSLDVSGCIYADLISFNYIINAEETEFKNVYIIRNSSCMNSAREIENDTTIELLYLYLYLDRIYLIIDNRELKIESIYK